MGDTDDLLYLASSVRDRKYFKLKEIVAQLKIKYIRELIFIDEILREERTVSQDEFKQSLKIFPKGAWKELIQAREKILNENNDQV